MKRLFARLGSLATLSALTLLLTGCPGGDPSLSDPTGCVFTSDAEVAGFIDFEAMNQSEFQRNLSKLPVLQQLNQAAGQKDPATILGISEDDILSGAFSLTGIKAAIEEKPDGMKLSFALTTAKPITTKKVRDLMAAMTDGKSERNMKTEQIDGSEFLVYRDNPKEPELLITSLKNGEGSLIVAGTRNAISDTIGRYQDASNETPGPVMDALSSALSDRQAWFVFTLPKELQDEIKKEMAGGNAGPMAGVGKSIQEMRSFVMSMSVSSTMDMQLGFNFSGDEEAKQFSDMVNGLMAAFIMPMLAMQPDVPQAVHNMSFEPDGDYTAVTLSFNEEETEKILQQVSQNMTFMP
ncbi:MAG: hypothetical protein ACFBZ8_06650 [Opitutales bacterium]